MWAAARSSTPSSRPYPRWPTRPTTRDLVADTARRRRVIDLGIRLANSDADPAVLAHLVGELADSTTAAHGGHRWEPPVPFGSGGEVPAFPVEVLPGWLGEYVAGVATATQTPPDLAGMLALAVLATVAAGSVEVEPRPGWREPLCLFVAVGMDAGARKSAVFTALTRPVADFERDQAVAALPGITETATLRRIADQAAATAEAAAGKAPASQQEEARAEAIARAAEASGLVVPPLPRWLVDDATPEALAGLLATYGRIALLSAPRGMCSIRWPAATTRPPGPTWACTSRAMPGICSRSTAAAAHPSTSSGRA